MSLQFVTFCKALLIAVAAEALDIPDTNKQNARRQNVDEAIFWSVVLGSTIPKLRALLKAGLLCSALLVECQTFEVEYVSWNCHLGLTVSADT